MNRRTFLRGAAGAFALSSVPGVIQTAFATEHKNVTGPIPYGALRIKNTDLHRLAKSLREQMKFAGKTLPEHFDPFPKKPHGDPVMQVAAEAKKNVLIGESAKMPSINQYAHDFDDLYQNEHLMRCDQLALQDSLIAWRVFIALHEITHDIALQTYKDAMNLNLYAFNKINKNEKADDAFFNLAAQGFPTQVMTNETFVAEVTATNIPERLADTAAAIYLMSNYLDREDSTEFLNKIMDLREAYYIGSGNGSMEQQGKWVMSWAKHDSASSIMRVIDTADSIPRGMTIVAATEMATDIITRQPEFQKPTKQIVGDMMDKMNARGMLWFGQHSKIFQSLSPSEQKRAFLVAQEITNARDRTCKLPMLSADSLVPTNPGNGPRRLSTGPMLLRAEQ